MSAQNRRTQSLAQQARASEGAGKDTANAPKSPQEHSRESGQWGAEEPDYGRSRGERPEVDPQGKPNSHGPQYEEGGPYPGTRDTSEKTPLPNRSANPSQNSYGGFKNEDPSSPRQQPSQAKKS